ncbi:MAG TPA: oligosaccharide flippase family protein [Puia sp.]|nr:oligosaccharide flippase family protein [Puia sp.]
MAKKVVKDLSSSTLQVILNQLFGLLIFYLTSRYLQKASYGELNWSIAVVSVALTLLTLGLDLIIVKRIAAGADIARVGGVHVLHTLIGGSIFIAVLLTAKALVPDFFRTHYLLVGVGISLVITFLSSPFKQIANGKEAFIYFAIMSVTGNIVKGTMLAVCALIGVFSAKTVVGIFIFASTAELVAGVFLVFAKLNTNVKPYWNRRLYKALLLESMPQLGVMIFDSALARVDWIILGLVSGATITADYSFAYKIFEISRLPMLVIAPIILPKFVRYLSHQQSLANSKENELKLLLRFETIICVLIPIAFNIAWTPVMSTLSAGKYGAADAPIYLVLSFSVPLHYYTNFLWTMAFAQRQLKLTFYITAFVSLLNITLNLILIPRYNAMGAACAFTASTVVQFILYKLFVNQQKLAVPIIPLVVCMVLAIVASGLANAISGNFVVGSFIAILAYLALIFLCRLFNRKDLARLKLLLAK